MLNAFTRRGLRVVLAGAVLAGTAASYTAAQAAPPSVGSPAFGAFCDNSNAAIAGTGASFAANAVNNVFIPTYNAACGKGGVSYSSTGSGAGQAASISHNASFAWGGTDDPLDAQQHATGTSDLGSATAPNPQGRVSPLHHIPIALGAVTVSYNLGSCGVGREGITLRSPQIALMYAGAITRWNDPALTALNPALAACSKAVRLVARSDVSGTTFAFKDYLSKRNPAYKAYTTPDRNTLWPAQELGTAPVLRGKGNGGVASVVATTDGAIGYVDYSTARSAGLAWALVDGPHGLGVSPSAADGRANCDLSAVGAVTPPSTLSSGWDQVSITDSPNPLGYPVCTFTYALVYNNLKTAYAGAMSEGQANTLVDFLGLAVDDQGQAGLPAGGYAKLPVNIQAIAKAGLASIAFV